jgi:hypothetical protein
MSESKKRNLYTYLNDGSTTPPFFEKMTLEEKSSDGYWINVSSMRLKDGRRQCGQAFRFQV